MIFRKKIQRSCAYCTFGTQMDEEQVLCIKKGVVKLDCNCRKFLYDPCKRQPKRQKALDFEKYDQEDYSL